MQPQMTTVLSLAEGTSLVTESVWSSRYRYVDELKRMGAHIQVDDKTAVVEGVEKLTGAPIQAAGRCRHGHCRSGRTGGK